MAGPSRRGVLAVATVAAAVLVLVVVASVVPRLSPPASSGPSANTSKAATPSATPSPELTATPVPGPDIDLADVTWYSLVSVGFGVVTGPGSDEPEIPQGYDELSVGTLDGRVTAQLHLSTRLSEEGHEGAWANGPYGATVLAGDDDGSHTRVFTVSSVDAEERTLYETDDSVVIGALHEGTQALYFVPVDRDTGLDKGLWRLPLASPTEPEPVYDDPIAEEPVDYASLWTMDWSADGDVLVTQACRMRSCRTLVFDTTSDEARRDDDGARLVGVTDADYVSERQIVSLATGETRPLGMEINGPAAVTGAPGSWYVAIEPYSQTADPRAYSLVAVTLGGGQPRTLVEVGPAEPTDARMKLGQESGVDLPRGWLLRWPPEGGRYMDIRVPPHVWYAGELVNVINGERLPVPPTVWPDSITECEPVPPAELPSGAAPGEPIVTPGGHLLWATWGAGTDDQIVQVVGGRVWGIASPGDQPPPGTEVAIRGQPGRVLAMGSIDGPWAIVWEEDGCAYEVQTLPGTTEPEAIEYAARYGSETGGAPTTAERQLVNDLIAFARDPAPERMALVPFADEVALGLADEIHATRTRTDLLDPEAWVLQIEGFRGYVGPISALKTLAERESDAASTPIRELKVSAGPHDHCASPPVAAPARLTGLRRLGVQPVGVTSCLSWSTVDLFLDGDGHIAGVTLDRWEP